MRLPRSLFTVTFLVVCVGLSYAAGGQRADAKAIGPANPFRSVEPSGSALLRPEMFIPPHGSQRAQASGLPQSPESADNLCYNIHSIVVSEDDHTGVTHTVRESTCSRATRFQMKNADVSK